MDLTFTIQKMDVKGDHKAVTVIHYTVSGTDDNNKTASLQRTIPLRPVPDGTEDGFVAFADVTQETATAWIKSALTPIHLEDSYVDKDGIMQGTETDIDLWPEVKQGIINDINSKIAETESEKETNLPWA